MSIALILMRRQLGWTQAQLAEGLKVALPTIGRWESWDPPKGVILERLANFAESRGLSVAADFRYEFEREKSRAPWLRLESDEEANYVKAVLLILRESEFAKIRPKLLRLLAPAINEPEARLKEDRHLRRLKAELEGEQLKP